MAEVVVSDEVDLDALLRSFDGDAGDSVFDFDAVPATDLWPPPATKESSGSPAEPVSPGDSGSSWKSDIERFLLDDDVDGGEMPEVDEGFQSEFFSDVLPPDGGKSEEVKKENKEVKSVVVTVDEDDDEDDAIRKKRRRQMRNRDSAMKSRERKKIYIKDLETKSKYLEMECCRLQYALQCCAAENMALHQSLQNRRALGALTARQESAVLVMESLLLGSLFWLMSIACLFHVPALPSLNQEKGSRRGRGPVLEVVTAKRIASEDSLEYDSGSKLILLRRRCRGTRSRMKPCLAPLVSVSA